MNIDINQTFDEPDEAFVQESDFTPRFPENIDSTMRSAFQACAWKFFQTHCRGVSSPYQNENLHFGGAFADGCKVTRNAFYRDGKAQGEAILLGQEEILRYWGDFEAPEGSVKNLENCLDTFDLYFSEAYPLISDHIVPFRISEDADPIVENSFAVPLPIMHPETGNPLLFSGRADMVGVLASAYGERPWEAKECWNVDEKTTSQMGPKWANQWRMRGQFMGYTWANLENGIPTAGTIVRGICIYKVKKPAFQEAFVQTSRTIVDRWYRQLLQDISQMVSCWNAGYWDYSYAESCSAYGGCGFLRVCELDEPEPYIQANYIERRWDPLKKGA